MFDYESECGCSPCTDSRNGIPAGQCDNLERWAEDRKFRQDVEAVVAALNTDAKVNSLMSELENMRRLPNPKDEGFFSEGDEA